MVFEYINLAIDQKLIYHYFSNQVTVSNQMQDNSKKDNTTFVLPKDNTTDDDWNSGPLDPHGTLDRAPKKDTEYEYALWKMHMKDKIRPYLLYMPYTDYKFYYQ